MRPHPIQSTDAIPAGGHYSQAVAAGGLIFVSGQLGVGRGGDPATPVAEQTQRVLHSLNQILAARGAGLGHIAKVTIYVNDISHWDEIDRIYSEVFGGHKPARSIVPVPELHFGAAIELEAIASDPSA